MNAVNNLEGAIRERMALLAEHAPGSVGDLMAFTLEGCAEDCTCRFRCRTAPWMRNFAGTLHGGMGAAILDQAMGFVSYCLSPGHAPTIHMSVEYLRPLIPGEDVLVVVRPVHAGHRLIRMSAEAFSASAPDKLCLTGSAAYISSENR